MIKDKDMQKQVKKRSTDDTAIPDFRRLLERARRTNARLERYGQSPAALPTVEEYRYASSTQRGQLTRAVRQFVENTPSDYNLRRAQEVRTSGKESGSRPAERTAARESSRVTQQIDNIRTESTREDNFNGMFELALQRFNTKLAQFGVWSEYVSDLNTVFASIRQHFGFMFANVFGKKIIDDWTTFENLDWIYDSFGQGASTGYFDAMNFLREHARATEQEYNNSSVTANRKTINLTPKHGYTL